MSIKAKKDLRSEVRGATTQHTDGGQPNEGATAGRKTDSGLERH